MVDNYVKVRWMGHAEFFFFRTSDFSQASTAYGRALELQRTLRDQRFYPSVSVWNAIPGNGPWRLLPVISWSDA